MTDSYTVSDLSSFDGEGQSVGTGHKYAGEDARFSDGEITVEAGDFVVFDDPDAGNHADDKECIMSDVMVGRVKAIFAVDYSTRDDYAVEIVATFPCGRLGVADSPVGIVREDGVVGGMDSSNAREEVSHFVDSDEYDTYMRTTLHSQNRGEVLGDGPCSFCEDGSEVQVRGE